MRPSPLLIAITLAASIAQAQPRPGPTVDWSQVEERIAWYGTWEGARSAAERTGRPILVMSGAPHCHYASGIW